MKVLLIRRLKIPPGVVGFAVVAPELDLKFQLTGLPYNALESKQNNKPMSVKLKGYNKAQI